MTDLEQHALPAIAIADLLPDTPIVCVTLRLAQTLSRTHDAQAKQQSGWRTLKSTTLNQWLNALYEALALRGQVPAGLHGLRVLNAFQEQLIWEQVIQSQIDASVEALFDLQALTASAAQAHKLSIEWNIPVDGSEFASEEQQQFQRWQTAFRTTCQKQGFIDVASLQAHLVNCLPHINRSLLPTAIAFAGFDHYTALEQQLQRQLSQAGVRVVTINQDSEPGAIQRMAPSDISQECLSIAQWAKQHLVRNPNTRLGIVVPNLETYQYPIQDALDDTLSPQRICGRNAHQSRLFNISLGQPLSSTPIVATALNLLQLISNHRDVDQSLIAALLHSPYWSNTSQATEADARARLDVAFRISVALKAPFDRYDQFARWFLDEQKLVAPMLRQHLHALHLAIGRKEERLLPSEWRHSLQTLLAKTGWLAEGKLNSIEFQTQQAFIDALNEFSRLDAITGKLKLREALKRLDQLCNERLFQPKTQGNPPIQILGVLESTGLPFDALWFAGLNESAWPPPAHPNPLLSVAAQRAQRAPNSCAGVQLEFARQIQHRLLRSATEIILSAPLSEGDTELQPSALISGYALTASPCLENLPWIQDCLSHAGSALESIEDTLAPAVEAGAHVRGGTWLLKAQAICPAWGYYQYRLGAAPLQDPVEGLDARQRGTLVHHVLESFWTKTENHAGLKALVSNGLYEAISQAIDTVLEAYNADKKHEPLKPRQHALEKSRLQRLLTLWLTLEAERTEPFSVRHCEHEFLDNIRGIEVRMFLDRIDQLEDGRLLIIDYKTGANIDTRNWASQRLTEPQLPIYAAIAKPESGEVAGVAFGQVHLNKLGFKGIGDGEKLLPGVEDLKSFRSRRIFPEAQFPDWTSVLTHWKSAIYTIADEVCQGDAGVRYANEKDLLYCDVLPLLRLAERAQQLELAQAASRNAEAGL